MHNKLRQAARPAVTNVLNSTRRSIDSSTSELVYVIHLYLSYLVESRDGVVHKIYTADTGA